LRDHPSKTQADTQTDSEEFHYCIAVAAEAVVESSHVAAVADTVLDAVDELAKRSRESEEQDCCKNLRKLEIVEEIQESLVPCLFQIMTFFY